jgi:hypothetical protein
MFGDRFQRLGDGRQSQDNSQGIAAIHQAVGSAETPAVSAPEYAEPSMHSQAENSGRNDVAPADPVCGGEHVSAVVCAEEK